MESKTGITWGIFCLRIGLGGCLALFALLQLFSADPFAHTFAKIPLYVEAPFLAPILSSLALFLGLLVLLGMYKTFTYGLGVALQAFMTIYWYLQLITPSRDLYYSTAMLALLFAWIALFLMRHFDTKMILHKRRTIFS